MVCGAGGFNWGYVGAPGFVAAVPVPMPHHAVLALSRTSMLYTGENRELPLFTYVALLNVATLISAASRPWRRLLLVSLLATVILYFAWYAIFYSPSDLALTLGFATAFFAIFAIAPLLKSVYRSDVPNSRVILFVGSLTQQHISSSSIWCSSG